MNEPESVITRSRAGGRGRKTRAWPLRLRMRPKLHQELTNGTEDGQFAYWIVRAAVRGGGHRGQWEELQGYISEVESGARGVQGGEITGTETV